jgi:hypothetical protein
MLFGCLAFSPVRLAQLPSPAPDGGYPNGNTAEGDNTVANLQTGSQNTAIGSYALFLAPAGYVLKGFMLLTTKPNGQGPATSYAVYTKS